MTSTELVWLLVPMPSLPLVLILIAFSRVMQSKKFEMQMLLQRGQALTKYLSAYGGSKQTISDSSVAQDGTEARIREIVNQIFRLRFSIPEYAAALAFNVLVNSAFSILVFSHAGIEFGFPASLMPYLRANPYLSDLIAGSLGALLHGIYEFCDRYRDGDLPPDVIFTAGARLLIAGAAGAIVGGVVKDQLAWVAAFAVGLLPPQSVLRFIDEQARKFVKLPDVSTIAEDPNLALLQGWNADVAKKFARAGVISIQQLACSNQFQLFLRSNIEWRVILDLSDQALLMLYVGDSIRKLNPLGMRSAVELAALDWYREDEDFFKGFTYEEAIKRIAIAIESDELAVRLLVRTVSEDATVKFLGVLWSDDTPSGGEDEDGGEDEGVEEDEDAKEQPAQSTEM